MLNPNLFVNLACSAFILIYFALWIISAPYGKGWDACNMRNTTVKLCSLEIDINEEGKYSWVFPNQPNL